MAVVVRVAHVTAARSRRSGGRAGAAADAARVGAVAVAAAVCLLGLALYARAAGGWGRLYLDAQPFAAEAAGARVDRFCLLRYALAGHRLGFMGPSPDLVSSSPSPPTTLSPPCLLLTTFAPPCHAPPCHAPHSHAPPCHAPPCHAPRCHAPHSHHLAHATISSLRDGAAARTPGLLTPSGCVALLPPPRRQSRRRPRHHRRRRRWRQCCRGCVTGHAPRCGCRCRLPGPSRRGRLPTRPPSPRP